MYKVFVPALLAVAVLGGCNSAGQQSSAPTAEQAPAATAIDGTVMMRDPMQLSADARLDIKLVEISHPEVPVAEKIQPLNGAQPPFSFTLDFDPAKIDPARTYVVNVLMFDGERRFVPALNSPVLTHGNGANAQIVLNPEATAGEKLKSEFNRLKAHIGGMKRIQDSFLNDDDSVAWDGFVDAGKVRFMRVTIEKGEGDNVSRSNVEYAYDTDGSPMAILKKVGRGNIRVGWDSNGQVILNEKSEGGAVSDDEAKAFFADAKRVAAMGQAKVPSKK